MARPKKPKVLNECKLESCGKKFYTRPSEARKFCSKSCAQQYKAVDKSWIKKREETCLDKYGYKNAFQSPKVQQVYKKNLKEKYGEENPFLVNKFKNKSNETIKEKYGVDVASQNKEVSKKISKALKGRELDRKDFSVIKYNKVIEYCNKVDLTPQFDSDYFLDNKINHSFKNKFKFKCNKCGSITEVFLSNGYLPMCKCSNYRGYSLIEEEIKEFILSLPTINDLELNKRDLLGNRMEIDIFSSKHKTAIEVNGVYWHSESMGKYKDYHLYKTNKCEERGIQLIHILDFEWRFKKPIIKSILKNHFRCNDDVVYARKCKTKQIKDNKTVKEFLIENHLQGYTHAKYNIGLYYNDELVSLMTFGKNRFKKDSNEYEMVRFCNKLNTNVVGGASKLFKFFNKNINLDNLNIISYADRRFFSGNLYEKLNFEFEKNTSPSYLYWKNFKVKNRMSCQKHKLPKLLENFDPNQTEYENMKNHGWKRVWDCGNSKWKYVY